MEINKIYNENCLETMAKMPDKFVDLVVTSPPYNMRTRIRNGQYTTREKSEHFSKKYKHYKQMLKVNAELKHSIIIKFYAMGQPLNDNILQFNESQKIWCLDVVSLVEEINTLED